VDRTEGGGAVTLQIEIWGIVQGVGFRPFAAKLADRLGVSGQVSNTGGHVLIVATADDEVLQRFVRALTEQKPRPSRIVSMEVRPLPCRSFSGFSVVDSGKGDDHLPMIPPDLAVCEHCIAELKQSGQRRYRHPFISCMECGPRYSIIDTIPYDRVNTTMRDFPMCGHCGAEYTDRSNRRYHAQTISCHDCGPQLLYRRTDDEASRQELAAGESALSAAVMQIRHGGIIAVKGIGGYHLACSPFDDSSVNLLRRFKNREEKPFAVMFRDMEQVRQFCQVDQLEEVLLTSSENPIVLLERGTSRLTEPVCRNSRLVGAMLPGTPLHWLLIDACGPQVMTSANLSGNPIIKDDEEMLECAGNGLSGVLYHHRRITVSLDDSVVRVIGGQTQMIRRSKGYAPTPLRLGLQSDRAPMLLALGGQLKSAFALTNGAFAYVSQYFGDLDDYRTAELYRQSMEDLRALLSIQAELCVCDMHPGYFTTTLAKETGLPVLQVQHHHAHAAAVIAERGLKGAVLAVAFDGTGYGADGTIWGGEFLLCDGQDMVRAGHLSPISLLGGDESMKDAWKSAMCHLRAAGLEDRITDVRYPIVREALRLSINTMESSSMGRLFDAVSAFLGLGDRNRYEGECAILLENAAFAAKQEGESPYWMEFAHEAGGVIQVSPAPVWRALARGLDGGICVNRLALGFHDAVARMVASVCGSICSKKGIHQVVLCGGVFQNALLLQQSTILLKQSGFEVFTNSQVPVGDGGICLGQAYLGLLHLGMTPSYEQLFQRRN